jgi:hypothetical protein
MAAGVVLVSSAALISFSSSDETVGSPTAVESSLRTGEPTSVPSPTLTSTSSVPALEEPNLPERAPISSSDTGEGDTLQALSPDVAQPTGLRIARLGVDAPVNAYGVDENRQMAVPENVTDVGWYKFGPTPGAPGSAVLAAHVDLYGQGPGVFFELQTMDEGDVVEVLYDDGSSAEFRVVARTVYQKDALPLDTIFSRQGASVLTLITCGGGFSRSSRTYDSNVVVYAVPMGGEFAPVAGTAS